MKLITNILMPIQSLYYGFNGEAVLPKRIITLPLMLGTPPHHLNLMIDFIVVKVSFSHNMIMDRPCIRMTKVVVSSCQLVMKFVREFECYLATIKGK